MLIGNVDGSTMRSRNTGNERVARSMKALAAALLLATPVYPHNAKTADLPLGLEIDFAAALPDVDRGTLLVRGEVLWYEWSIESNTWPTDEGDEPGGARDAFPAVHRFHLRARDAVSEIDALDESAARVHDSWRF